LVDYKQRCFQFALGKWSNQAGIFFQVIQLLLYPEKLLVYVDKHIKANSDTIVKSLQGNWLTDQLYLLEDCYCNYQHYKERISACDVAIENQLQQYLKEIFPAAKVESNNTSTKQATKNKPKFNTCGYFKAILGTDVTAIFGISNISALEILSETGTDMTKWETSKHFVSWLNLCPNNKISGGKLISSMLMRKKPNVASQAFRNAANAVQRSDNWLGDYFRRMKSKGGNKYAMVATASKMATIYYRMVLNKVEFNPLDLHIYQQKYKQAKITYLERKLHDLKREVA